MALELLDCERVTLFLIAKCRRELRGRTGTDGTDEMIRLKFGEGIAGYVAKKGGGLLMACLKQQRASSGSRDGGGELPVAAGWRRRLAQQISRRAAG